jgi:hypothetical protein
MSEGTVPSKRGYGMARKYTRDEKKREKTSRERDGKKQKGPPHEKFQKGKEKKQTRTKAQA